MPYILSFLKLSQENSTWFDSVSKIVFDFLGIYSIRVIRLIWISFSLKYIQCSKSSYGSNYVQSLIVRSQKQGGRVRYTNNEHVGVRSMFEKWCLSLFDKWFSKSFEGCFGLMLGVHSLEAKIQLLEFYHQ